MNSTAAKTAARTAASARVIEACHQTIDLSSSRLDGELAYIVSDMAVLARAIQVMAENPVCIGATGDTVFTGFQQCQVSDVKRLAEWISDIGERALTDFDRPPHSDPAGMGSS